MEFVELKIFNLIKKFLPKKWSKCVFYACYLDDKSYTMNFYIGEKGKYKSYLELKIDSNAVLKTFMNINIELSPIRKNLKKNEKWYVLTLTFVNSNKNDPIVEIKKDYKDHSEEPLSWVNHWKKEFLI